MHKKMNSNPSMQAITIKRINEMPQLSLSKFAIPIPEDDEILIKVKACGVNWADIEQSLGYYPAPAGASDILGLEVSGVVVNKGKNVKDFKMGDRVMALVAGGGYAEYAVAHQELSFLIPNCLDFVSAAAVPEACFTIWGTVYQLAQLKTDETLLVHGGTGSIGSTLIQLAAHFGTTVYTTSGSDEKCELAKSLGAHAAINYQRQDFVEVLQDMTQGLGVHVILDSIGGEYFNQHINLLRRGGRLVLIDCQKEYVDRVDISKFITRNISIFGSVLRPRSLLEKSKIAKGIKDNIIPLIEKKYIKPLISHRLPLSQAQLAHDLMRKHEHIGKVILISDD